MPHVTFIEPNGKHHCFDVKSGETLLDIAQDHDLDMEGVCEGSMACATCHVIVDPKWANRLTPPSAEEEDALDMAVGLKPTSRLGCQIKMNNDLDGLIVYLPK